MRKSTLRSFLLFALLLTAGTRLQAQLTGTKTIPGDYASFTAAVADLNTQGVGAGGVIFNIASGYTETGVAAVLTVATNPPSATRPIVFQKSGAGANPLFTAGVGTSTTVDGIIKFNGIDYVTFDGIDLQEDAANVTPTTQMEWGYAVLKSGAANGSQYNTIKNATVTLNKSNVATVGIYSGNHLTTVITALSLTSFAGTNSYNKYYNNTVQNSFHGVDLLGFASVAPFDLYDQGNEIGVDGVSANPSRVLNFGGGATGTANGITTTAQNNLKIFNTTIDNTVGAGTSTTLNGIFTSAASNASLDIYNNTITLAFAGTTASMFAINNTAGATGAGNTINIYNNTVTGCSFPTATTGEFRGISQTATATYTNIYNNTVTNNSQAGTGNFNAINYGGASATLVLQVNLNNNTISGNTKTGTAGNFNCIFASASTYSTSCFNNMMFNNSASATSSAVAGYFNFGFGINEQIYNNQFYNNVGGTGTNTGFDVRSGSGPTDKQIYGNVIRDFSCSGTIAGILVDYGTYVNVRNNNIYNLSTSATTGVAGTPSAIGINIGGISSVQNFVNTYNNYVSDIKAPAITTSPAVAGIAASGTGVSNLGIWHNTVYLNATTSSATTFSTAGILLGSTPISINMSNNIVVNTSATGPTGGLAAAIQRIGVSLNSYGLSSGHNCLFAGVPSANRVIFTDGTNSDQTLQAFKNRVGPREQSSFSELPPFVNSATAPYDLHLQTGIATQCESGGKGIAAVNQDFDGIARNASTPDVGADEIAGITVDIASPDIQYTLLGNSGLGANRVVPAFASITDPSGINVAASTKPRMYYKRSTNANTYVDNTSGTDGWKFVEASNAASPFAFTIDYSLLFGGPVVAGDLIQYFVTAQDLNATPRIGLNNGGFTAQPASVALAAANFPLTNTINQYAIVANTYTGVIPVGPTETITSLTNAGGIFALINAGVLSGNVTISITGDLTAETGTSALTQWAEQGTGGYTVSIVPSAAAMRVISGSNATLSLIRLDGADRTTIDGRFGGTGSFFTIRNTSNAAPTVGFINDAQNNTLRNCIVESGNTATTAIAGGAILLGATTGLFGNDNNTITANEIRDRSDVPGTPSIGINCLGGSASSTNQFNSGCVISDNNIHDWYLLNGTSQFGILVGTGNTNFSITGNSLYQTAARSHTVAGAITRAINVTNALASTALGGFDVSGNFVGGSAPGANGTDWTLSSTSTHTFSGIFLATGLIPSTLQNNVVRKINYTSIAPSAGTNMFVGIQAGQGNVLINNNTVGAGTGTGSISVNITTGGASSAFTAGVFAACTNGTHNVTNNTVGAWTFGGTNTTAALIPQHIQYQGSPVQNFSVSNNTVGSTTTANSIQNNLTAAPCISFGIRLLVSTGITATVSNNTIQNVTDLSVSPSSADYGILLINSVGATSSVVATNNVIKDFAASPLSATPSINVIAISLQGYAGRSHNISGNMVSAITNPNTGAGAGYVMGIQVQGNTTGGSIGKNKVWDIRNAQTGAGPGIAGIYVTAGDGWNLSNNMVSVSNGAGTNDLVVFGMADYSTGVCSLNYNSVYVGGNATGATATYAFARGATSRISLKNNLFYNDRTSSAGNSFAVGNLAAVPGDGWTNASASYNTYIAKASNRIGDWGGAIIQSFAQWKASSLGDIESYSDTTLTVPAASLFLNTATGDLNINPANNVAWYVNGKGIAGTASGNIASDFGGTVRSTTLGTPTDIGADEFTPNVGVNPIPCIASGAPAPSTLTTYSFAGRKLGEILWGPTGTVPTSMSWTYYSGVPGPGTAGSNINSYWDVAATGGTGYSYTLNSFYTVAEQNAILDASLNLGKKTGASAWYYLAGTPSINAAGKMYSRTGLNSFSQFTLGGNAVSPNFTITTNVISGVGSFSPAGPVSVTPLNNQSFTIIPDPCYVIDSVFADAVYVGSGSTYEFTNVAANRSLNVKFRFNGVVPAVTISANPGTSICAGTNVTFTAVPTNGGGTPAYQWKVNGGNVGTNSATYSNNTLVNGDIITCVLTSNATCVLPTSITSNTLTIAVVSSVTPSVTISANPGATVCPGTVVTFTAVPLNGGATPSYQWRLNGGNVGTNIATYSNPGLATGNTVSCVITSSDACASPTTATSNVITMTVADAQQPAWAACPSNITVSTSASSCDAVVSWTAPTASDNCSVATSSSTNAPGSTFALGATTVTYTAVDPSSNTGTCTFTVTVNDSIAPVASCQAVTVTLDNAGNGSTSSSAVDNGSTDNCAIDSISLSQTAFTCGDAGANTVTLTVTDATGNVGTCTAIVTVNAPAVTGTLLADTTSCGYNVSCASGNDGVAHATGGGGCPSYTYLWSTSDTGATVSGLSAGTYFVTITDGIGGTYVDSVVITAPSAIQVGSTSSNTCFGDSTGSIDITATGGNDCAGYTYQWSNGASSEDLSGLADGTYFVTVTDPEGCSTIDTVVVSSFAALNPSFTVAADVMTSVQTWTTYQWLLNGSPVSGATANTYTAAATGTYSLLVTDVNGCSAVTDTSTVVGIEESIGWMELGIFPNPARGEFKLHTSSPINYAITVSIHDMFGRRYTQLALPELADEVSFDLSNFAAGTYMVEVATEAGHRKLFKLVVQ